jgi:uncharacterized protein (DUF2236 family)
MTSLGKPEFYFPPGKSVARRVHEERAVGVLYGQRALLIGSLEPLTYTGTMLSTRSQNLPFLRLARTAKIQETVLLGTREEADRALASVHKLHESVEGSLPLTAGKYSPGTRYTALDPELMLWTLAVIADSARAMFELLIRPLSMQELEALWRDYMLFGELFGLLRQDMPHSYREFDAWMEERIRSSDLHATPHALEVAPLMAFQHPVPLVARPALNLNNLMIKGTLPERVRNIFAINWDRPHEVSFRAIASAHRRLRRALPRRARRGRNDIFFDVIIRTERRRGGTKTPALLDPS